MLGPALIVLLAWLALAGGARAADGPALLEATAPPVATAPAPDAAGAQPLAVATQPPPTPPVRAVGPDDAAPVTAAVASPPPPAAAVPPPPFEAVPPPPAAAPFAGAEFGRAIGDLVGDTLLGSLPEAVLPDLRDELGPTAGLIGQVGDSVRGILDPLAESPTPMPPVPAPPGAGAGTPPPVLGPPPPIVASVRSAGLPPVQPVATTRGPSVLAGDSGSAPTALAVADLARVADHLGAAAGKGTAIGPPGSAARTRALAPDGSEAGVAPLAATPAAGAATTPASALPGPPGRAPVPPAPVSERTAPTGVAPASPAPFLPPAPAPAPADHTGLSGLGGSSTSTLLLGVAALCGLIALARPPNGLRRMSLQPAPYVPAMFAVSLERPG